MAAHSNRSSQTVGSWISGGAHVLFVTAASCVLAGKVATIHAQPRLASGLMLSAIVIAARILSLA